MGLGNLAVVREAKERRIERACEMFAAGATPLMVSRKLGLSRIAMQKLRHEWAASFVQPADDFDPALAIGVYDYERPMPVHCRLRHKRTKPEEKPSAPYRERLPTKEAADEAWSLESPLLKATDRALRLRTAEAYDKLGVLLKRPPRVERSECEWDVLLEWIGAAQ